MPPSMTSPSSTSSSRISARSFVLRLAAFVALILLAQTYFGLWTEASFPELARLDRYIEERAEFIYFGDSVLHYRARNDRIRHGIPELIQELFPDRSLRSVDHPAYHFGMYRLFCDYLKRSGGRPSVIIMPITLRSFSAAWQRRPHYKFPRESVILEYRTRHYDSRPLRAFLQPLLIFKAFDLRPAPSRVEGVFV